MRTWLIVAVATMGVCGGASAGDALAERPNAAEVYAEAAEAIPVGSREKLQDWVRDRKTGVATTASPQALARELETAVREVVRAARIEHCEFEDRRTSPMEPAASFLKNAHSLGLAIWFSSQFAAEAGEGNKAAELIVAQLTYAQRLGSARSILGSLLSAQQANYARLAAIDGLERGMLDAGARARIAEKLLEWPAEDRFGGRAALQREGELLVSWLEKGAPGARAGLPMPQQDAEGAEAFKREAENARRYFAEALRAWDAEGDEAAEALQRRLEAGEFGLVVGVTTPGWAAARRQFRQCGAWMDELSARLMEGLD